MTLEELDAAYRRARNLSEVDRWTDAERTLGTVLATQSEHYARCPC